ncbi:Replicase polyprotein 1ab [Frankliniella fusca]|uniref:Replicase polyprotein 1ab n=1 Tax=Frankliniella fusca TaxID=407009 RepID=A0AAE1LHX2_9NEOP|nr:Replicase polyprotein 1ab [Frankliniella fusca]
MVSAGLRTGEVACLIGHESETHQREKNDIRTRKCAGHRCMFAFPHYFTLICGSSLVYFHRPSYFLRLSMCSLFPLSIGRVAKLSLCCVKDLLLVLFHVFLFHSECSLLSTNVTVKSVLHE